MQDFNTYMLIIGMFTITDDEYLVKIMNQSKEDFSKNNQTISKKKFFISVIIQFLKKINEDNLIDEVAANIFKTWISNQISKADQVDSTNQSFLNASKMNNALIGDTTMEKDKNSPQIDVTNRISNVSSTSKSMKHIKNRGSNGNIQVQTNNEINYHSINKKDSHAEK